MLSGLKGGFAAAWKNKYKKFMFLNRTDVEKKKSMVISLA